MFIVSSALSVNFSVLAKIRPVASHSSDYLLLMKTRTGEYIHYSRRVFSCIVTSLYVSFDPC